MSLMASCLGIRPGPRRHDNPWLPPRSTLRLSYNKLFPSHIDPFSCQASHGQSRFKQRVWNGSTIRDVVVVQGMTVKLRPCLRLDEAVSGGKPPVVGLLS